MAKFRILSLDGGGTWALIQVMALMDIYGADATGHEVLRHFDLVAANSGGSIVLGCLVENMPLSQTLAFFLSLEKRKSIFVEKFHLPYTPKYKTVVKFKGLQASLPQRGEWLLPQAAADIPSANTNRPVHLLIIGFDYDRNCARFFRSAPATGAAWGNGDAAQVRLVEAIHASTTAPVLYFDKPAKFPSEPARRYWDGAVTGCNNPVLAAVTEAIVLGHAPDAVAALAIGTGTVSCPPAPAGAPPEVFYATREEPGILPDALKLASAIVDDPPDVASFLVHVLTGGQDGVPAPADSRVVRMSPMISPVRNAAGDWTLPQGMNVDQFSVLANLAMDAVKQEQVLAIQMLAQLWLDDHVRNQPIRMNGNLKLELGQDWYSQAKAAWKTIQ
ncbi:MAG: patatin-like phospholipase family protein [Acidobacteriota bacterium]